MKIAIISELYGGGVEKVNTTLAQKINEQNHQITFISMVSDPSEFNEQHLPFKCVFLNRKSKKEAGSSLISELRNQMPDIILTSCLVESYFALTYKKLYASHVKVVYVQHSVYSLAKGNSMKQKLLNNFFPHLFRVFDLIDGIIFVSNGVKKDFKQYFPNYSAKDKVIYNPITKAETLCRYKEIDKNSLKLVTAGRLEKEKKHETIIEALALLRERGINASLVIFGEGSQKEYLVNKCKELNLEQYVMMPGFVKNVSEKMLENDIFVLSSKHESFGNVLVEAMNIGLPVVSTNCPVGPSEILNGDEFGALVAIDDCFAMADAIESVMENHSIDNVTANYKRSLDFSEEKSVQEYIDFFLEIM